MLCQGFYVSDMLLQLRPTAAGDTNKNTMLGVDGTALNSEGVSYLPKFFKDLRAGFL